LSENSLLDTSLERTVEQRVEHLILSLQALVVGLDILLEGDAAMESQNEANVNKGRVES
jgi:hypothetical protein